MLIYAQGQFTQDLSAIRISPSVFSLIQIHASGFSQWVWCCHTDVKLFLDITGYKMN